MCSAGQMQKKFWLLKENRYSIMTALQYGVTMVLQYNDGATV